MKEEELCNHRSMLRMEADAETLNPANGTGHIGKDMM